MYAFNMMGVLLPKTAGFSVIRNFANESFKISSDFYLGYLQEKKIIIIYRYFYVFVWVVLVYMLPIPVTTSSLLDERHLPALRYDLEGRVPERGDV